jgi:hypothetical protein
MLLPNPSSTTFPGAGGGGGAFGQFTWVSPDSHGHEGGSTTGPAHQLNTGNNPSDHHQQGLSLSLSTSLQHLEAAKAEELRMGDGSGLLYYNNPEGSSSSAHYNQYKNLVGHQSQQVHVGFGSSSFGVVNVLRNSKYVKAAQELLEEFCSVGRGQLKKNKLGRQNSSLNPSSNPAGTSGGGGGGGASSSSSKDVPPTLSAADRIEHQRRKVKLLSMLDEACTLSLISTFSLYQHPSHPQESKSSPVLLY